MNQLKQPKLAAKAERVVRIKFTAVASSMIPSYLSQERIKEITDKARQPAIEDKSDGPRRENQH